MTPGGMFTMCGTRFKMQDPALMELTFYLEGMENKQICKSIPQICCVLVNALKKNKQHMVIGSDGWGKGRVAVGGLLSGEGWHLSGDLDERKKEWVQGRVGRWHTWIKVRGRKTGRRCWPRSRRAFVTYPPSPATRIDPFRLSIVSEQSPGHLFSLPLFCFKSPSGQPWLHQSPTRF